MKKRKRAARRIVSMIPAAYGQLVTEISVLLNQARRGAVRSVNAILTATYWQIGRRIVEHEQHGKARAEYGEELLMRLADDLTTKHGRGYSRANLQQMRLLYLGWQICQTPSGKFEAKAIFPALPGDNLNGKCQTLSGKLEIVQTVPAKSGQGLMPGAFPLSWSQYVRLMSVEKPHARAFYETEAIRGGWTVRQLDRQIGTQFYERAAHSKRPKTMLAQGQIVRPEDAVSVEDTLRDPYLLEFLDLKDEYSEHDWEILQTPSGKFEISQTASAKFASALSSAAFPLGPVMHPAKRRLFHSVSHGSLTRHCALPLCVVRPGAFTQPRWGWHVRGIVTQG